jgi:hypothetical protein
MATYVDNNAISNIPIELLEMIAHEVVGDDKIRTRDYRNNFNREIYCRGPRTDLLAFRATSKAFRDSSWRALAKAIGNTLFDVASKDKYQEFERNYRERRLIEVGLQTFIHMPRHFPNTYLS